MHRNDLHDMVDAKISIDEFQPKAGDTDEIIVVAFTCLTEASATDLNTFIQRSVVDYVDVEVSPHSDTAGRFYVFVEFERNKKFLDSFMKLVHDIENVTGRQDWMVKPYLSDSEVNIDDPSLSDWIVTDPNDYADKAEFKNKVDAQSDMNESAMEFFKLTDVETINSHRNRFVLENSLLCELVDVGHGQIVLERQMINESPISFSVSLEENKLASLLGHNCEVTTIEDLHVVTTNGSDDVIVLKNLELIY